MKRLSAFVMLAIVATVAMAPAFAHAAFDAADWQWKAPLAPPQEKAAGFVRVALPPWVFDRSRPDLADLRVVDQDGNLAPHVIRWGQGRPETRTEWRPVRLINRTSEPGKYARVVADFGSAVEKDTLKVETPGANFRRRVLIEGGADATAWEQISDNLYLFDISQSGQNFKADTLRFPVNNFRYLRLTVYNMPDDPKQVEIVSVEAAHTRVSAEELAPLPAPKASLSHDDKGRATVCDLDLGYHNLPVAKAQLEISDPYFYRGYTLEGRNELTVAIRRKTETGWDEKETEAPWNSVQNGVIYRVRDGEKVSESVTLENLNAPYRYLRLRIFDGDNPPLALNAEKAAVSWRPAAALFEYKPDRAYSLMGGNPNARAPEYDLARAVADLGKRECPAMTIGAPSVLKHEETLAPWTERHKILIGALLVVAVVAVAALMISGLRGLKQDGAAPRS